MLLNGPIETDSERVKRETRRILFSSDFCSEESIGLRIRKREMNREIDRKRGRHNVLEKHF